MDFYEYWTPQRRRFGDRLAGGEFQFHACIRVRLEFDDESDIHLKNHTVSGVDDLAEPREQENVDTFEVGVRPQAPGEEVGKPYERSFRLHNFDDSNPKTFQLQTSADLPPEWKIEINEGNLTVDLKAGESRDIPIMIEPHGQLEFGQKFRLDVTANYQRVLVNDFDAEDTHLDRTDLGGISIQSNVLYQSSLDLLKADNTDNRIAIQGKLKGYPDEYSLKSPVTVAVVGLDDSRNYILETMTLFGVNSDGSFDGELDRATDSDNQPTEVIALFTGTTELASTSSDYLEVKNATARLNYLQPGKVVGRAVTGPVSAVDDLGVVVLTQKGEVKILIDSSTEISAPPAKEVGLDVLTVEPITRVAVLTDRSPIERNGNVASEPVTALKLTVIPSKATRQHRRVVVTEKGDGGQVGVIDAGGETSEFTSKQAEGLKRGDNLVFLVQPGIGEGPGERLKAVINAKAVDQRLQRLASEESRQAGDTGKAANLKSLLRSHEENEERRLQRTLDKAPEAFKEPIKETIEVLKTEARDGPPSVVITSPSGTARVVEGSTITIKAEAEDDGEVAFVDLTINGVSQSVTVDVTFKLAALNLEYSIPLGVSSLEIQVTVTDNLGNTASDTRTVNVVSDPPPTVSIISPAGGATVVEGGTVDVKVEASDNGDIKSVELFWPIIGDMKYPEPVAGYWVWVMPVPVLTTSTGTISSSVPPHAFVGTVTINGTPAPDGTVVTAWVEGGAASTLQLKATATDDSSQLGSDVVNVQVVPRMKIASTAVSDGNYAVVVRQLQGESFAGRTVIFIIENLEATQTGIWQQGGADVLHLTGSR